MKRTLFMMLVTTMTFAVGAVLAHRACADDETNDVEVRIRAPLDDVQCTAMPPTITVLGLVIDISAATIDGGGDSGGDGGGSSDGGGSQGEDGDQQGGGTSGGGNCAALMTGQTVEVRLASDATPLAATEVSAGGNGGGDGSEVSLQAPVQNVNGDGTIMVLGLTIDVSQANMGGSDDDSEDGQSQPVDLTQLMPGQIVEVQLASNQTPLTATSLDVKNFANQLEVEVDDQSGDPVDDSSDDMDVEVDDTVVVQTPPPAGAASAHPRHAKKVLHFRLTSASGSMVLSGLPTGRANISVTRVNNGAVTSGRRSLRIRGNAMRSARVRLRLPGKH